MLLTFFVATAIDVVAVVVRSLPLPLDNYDDKYNSTFRVIYAAVSRGGNDTFLCLWTYYRNGM
jgi:hypothetical protein